MQEELIMLRKENAELAKLSSRLEHEKLKMERKLEAALVTHVNNTRNTKKRLNEASKEVVQLKATLSEFQRRNKKLDSSRLKWKGKYEQLVELGLADGSSTSNNSAKMVRFATLFDP